MNELPATWACVPPREPGILLFHLLARQEVAPTSVRRSEQTDTLDSVMPGTQLGL